MSTSSAIEPGTKLAERFRLEDRVHESSGATLWKAIDEVLARPVAVHTFDPDFPRLNEVISAARTASRLTDPRLTQVFDATEDDGCSYVVSEWVTGDNLADLVAAGPMEPERAAALVAEVAEALAHAHEAGVPHLCLTPEHLVWTAGGTVKLLGLGVDAVLADVVHDSMRVEDAARGDAEGLGRLLYAGLTGHWPGEETPGGLPVAPTDNGHYCTPRQVTAGVPGYLDTIVCRALLPESKRGQTPLTSPAEVAEALSSVPRPAPMPMPAPPPAPPLAASRSEGLDTAASPQRHTPPPPPPYRPVHQPHPSGGGGALGKVAVGLVVLLVMAAVGLGAWTLGRSIGKAGDAPEAGGGASPTPTTGTTATREVKPDSAQGFDPLGDGDERSELASLALDGKPSTDWHSESYPSADFGRLKKGVGLLIDLKESVAVKEVTADFGPVSGGAVELRVGDSKDLDDLGAVAKASGLGGKETLTAKSPKKGRYVLLWFTEGPSYQGKYRAQVNEVKVRAVK
ncbi:protein kinase family protein [Planomonospora parontospora]|uniref:protein kinase family protein n=1 Tax=Planomonospora parontospora TaxID=58119 RepID=UPI0016717E54|nr:protein kinase family protein [Planomonospora parontospora]GGL39972.1 serine/threonine protein kinase [Planomonospora parontospora subsp. antibiotica]GII16283.1 serine/threonine protein kinase [Planomonospora parontospora subsp. antibiotica]